MRRELVPNEQNSQFTTTLSSLSISAQSLNAKAFQHRRDLITLRLVTISGRPQGTIALRAYWLADTITFWKETS